jgi:hypothetical protein
MFYCGLVIVETIKERGWEGEHFYATQYDLCSWQLQ